MASDNLKLPVYLDVDNDKLYNGSLSITINKQACRCLILLISRAGTVVSKEEVIEECWVRYGMFVSDVTVRQTLFNIRKALSQLNLEADSLTTVRGKGYMLVAGAISVAEKEEMISDRIVCSSHAEEHSSKESQVTTVKHNTRVYLFCIFIFVSTVTARHLLMIHSLEYNDSGSYQGVRFYSQKGIFNDMQLQNIYSELKDVIHEQEGKNNNIRHIYMNKRSSQNASVFACDKPIEDDFAKCISVIILGGDN